MNLLVTIAALFTVLGTSAYGSSLPSKSASNFRAIWRANAGTSLIIREIKNNQTNELIPFQVIVDFMDGVAPRITLTILRDGEVVGAKELEPNEGTVDQHWLGYSLPADNLFFDLGINQYGDMPINVHLAKG